MTAGEWMGRLVDIVPRVLASTLPLSSARRYLVQDARRATTRDAAPAPACPMVGGTPSAPAPADRMVGGTPSAPSHQATIHGDVIERAVAAIRSQVQPIPLSLPDPEDLRTFLLAVATMNLVHWKVRPHAYAHLQSSAATPLPQTAREILTAEAGYCGDQVKLFLHLLQRLDIPARSIDLFYRNPDGCRESHVAAEVSWGGQWRFFDIRAGAFFRPPGAALHELLSLEEMLGRRERDSCLVANAATCWNQVHRANGGSPLAYLDLQPEILLAGVGTVRLDAVVEPKVTRYDWQARPNFFGAYPTYEGLPGNLRVHLPVGDHARSRLRIHIREGRFGNGWLRFSSVAGQKRIHTSRLRPGEFEFGLGRILRSSPWLQLQVERGRKQDPCFVEFDQLELHS